MDIAIKKGIKRIENELLEFFDSGKKLFMTSSFQTHSIPLIHIVNSIDSDIPIYFLDTGYHFTETIEFKEQLKEEFSLNIIDLRSNIPRINQRDAKGNLMYASDPDYCCYINKVQPLEPILKEFDIWISGVRKSQTKHRENLGKTKAGKYNTLHYHPILEWDSKMIYQYRKEYDLPEHPLEKFGYFSVGCMPCTRKMDLTSGSERDSRWVGLNKSECGLHTETIEE